jgi:hypothetical protein
MAGREEGLRAEDGGTIGDTSANEGGRDQITKGSEIGEC